MLIQDKHYQTIWLNPRDNKTVQIIDQRFLPFQFIVKDLRDVEETYDAIRNMAVRGAPLIGAAAAFGMYLATLHPGGETIDGLQRAADRLKSSRPTAVNLEIAVNRQVEAIFSKKTALERRQEALKTALKIAEEEKENCYQIGQQGLPLIQAISKEKKSQPVNILTHCNAGWLACVDYGTATAPVYLAHDKGIQVHVWVDETRPRNQGARLTAYELGQHGVPHTVIADNTGGHLMQHGMVDLVIVGCDRATRSGDIANKIGTYLKALAAKDNNIPFYAALPSSTFDWSMKDGIKEIPIEQRDQEEVTYMEGMLDHAIKKVRLTPENSLAANYGFDVTPARLVSGIITEKGICQANEESIMHLFGKE